MAGRVVSPAARSIATATTVSFMLHLVALAALAADACWPFLWGVSSAPRPTSQIRLIATYGDPPSISLGGVYFQPQLADRSTTTANKDSGAIDIADPNVPPQVMQRVAIAIDEARQQSSEQSLKQLKTLTGKLDRLSNEHSVDDMAAHLGQWLGTVPRAVEPAQAVNDKNDKQFDYATAQLHDVRRQRDDQGVSSYTAVLVDAQGRTRESLLTPEEGADAYKTMQLVKSSPLTELIYRRIAMGLLDDIIRAAQAAEELADDAPMPATTASNSVSPTDEQRVK